MKLVAQLALGTWLGLGLTALSAWAVSVWTRMELAKEADLTSRLVWHMGRAVIWGGAAALGGAVAAAAAMMGWTAVR